MTLNPEGRQAYLAQLQELLAQIEAGEINAAPSNEEAMVLLRAEIAEIESKTPLDREPGFLNVGQPMPGFPPGSIPPGSIGLYPDASPMLLVMGLDSPTPEDLDAFHASEGWIEFALVPMGKLLVTLIRFPSQTHTGKVLWGLWMDAAWAHREQASFTLEHRGLEKAAGENDPKHMRFGINCVLVDSDTDLVAGMRFFTLSPHYSRLYERELLVRLNAPPISDEEFLHLALAYQSQYPTPKKLLDRAIVRCKAGLLGK